MLRFIKGRAKTDATGTAGDSPGTPADVTADDPGDLEVQCGKLIGEWYATDWLPVVPAFNEDGTGVFARQEGGTCSFTFEM